MSLGALALGVVGIASTTTHAADHTEATTAGVGDPAVNMGDLYAWHTAAGEVVMVITVDGAKGPEAGQSGTYDRDALYGFHVDTDGDNVADEDVYVRFAQNDHGGWGLRAVGVPGATEALEGAVESPVDDGDGHLVYAGLRDDPFFFDLDGFGTTLTTGELSFDNTRDSMAGTNATAIVVQFPAADLGGVTSFGVWATTGRIGS